ncbi:hybrid sensor histidine kinase/response regulator [Bacteroidia bacterium]|nr:hybrid sensor histidine kinase/response regulator [Bacteroidia bacterium]
MAVALLLAVAEGVFASEPKVFRTIDGPYASSLRLANTITQDNQGFIWIGTLGALVRFDGMYLEIIRNETGKEQTPPGNFIRVLCNDPKTGIMWIGTENGLCSYDPESRKFTLHDNIHPNELHINALTIDAHGFIWIGTSLNGLIIFDPATGQSISPQNYFKSDADPGTTIRAFCHAGKSEILIASGHKIFRAAPDATGSYRINNCYPNDKNKKTDYSIRALETDHDRNVYAATWMSGIFKLRWEGDELSLVETYPVNEVSKLLFARNHLYIGSKSGISAIDMRGSLTSIPTESRLPFTNATSNVNDLFMDRSGIVWAATNTGVVQLVPNLKPFDNRRLEYRGSRLDVSALDFTEKGELLLGTTSGLFRAEKNGPVLIMPQPVAALKRDASTLWIGTSGSGVIRYDLSSGKSKNYRGNLLDETSLSNNYISAIETDLKGNLWVGLWSTVNSAGLNRLDVRQEVFYRYTNVSNNPNSPGKNIVTSLLCDSSDDLWIGTRAGGLDRLADKERPNAWFEHYNSRSKGGRLKANMINTLFQAADSSIWIGAHNALIRYDRGADDFTYYDKRDGLEGDFIYSVNQDASGNIWAATDRGLSMFDPHEGKFYNFNEKDGVDNGFFNLSSSVRDRSGKLYFGTTHGILTIDPDSLTLSDFVPPLVLTGIIAGGKPISSPTIRPDEYDAKNNRITLRHDQNSVCLNFAALDYLNPQKVSYQYRLDPVDAQWNSADAYNRSVSYLNLGRGKYLFRLRSTNSDGIWNGRELSLHIVVKPIWYLSVWALILWFVLVVGILAFVSVFFVTRSRLEHKLLAEKHLKEFHRTQRSKQVEHFSKLVNDLKTSLMLVTAPVEQIIRERPDSSRRKYLEQLIDYHSGSINRVITRLERFNAVANDEVKLSIREGNLDETLTGVVDSLSVEYGGKISVRLDRSHFPVAGFFDAAVFEQIATNLLECIAGESSERSQINISLRGGRCEGFDTAILETDTNISFPEGGDTGRERQKPDYPWVAYTYAEKLVQLHRGRLIRKQTEGGQTGYRIELVTDRNFYTEDELTRSRSCFFQDTGDAAIPQPVYHASDTHADGPAVAILDASGALSGYIMTILPEYDTHVFINIKECLKFCFGGGCSLLVIHETTGEAADVSRILRNDTRTLDLPIIVLSGDPSEKARARYVESGADAMLSIPFEARHLRTRIAKLTELRSTLKDKYSKPFATLPDAQERKPAPRDMFMERVDKVLEQSYKESAFGIEDLATRLKTSKTSLHRMLKKTVGCSANEYIRGFRLKKAAELLSKGNYSIEAICYETGFNTPSYFAKCFKQQFGMLPNEYLLRNASKTH